MFHSFSNLISRLLFQQQQLSLQHNINFYFIFFFTNSLFLHRNTHFNYPPNEWVKNCVEIIIPTLDATNSIFDLNSEQKKAWYIDEPYENVIGKVFQEMRMGVDVWWVEWGGTARTLYEIGIMAMRSGKDKHLLACRLTLEASSFSYTAPTTICTKL